MSAEPFSAGEDAADLDVPDEIMDLQLRQVTYDAALGTTASVLQRSLLDFLR
jgi:flagellar hook-associated protein 3 FlgL